MSKYIIAARDKEEFQQEIAPLTLGDEGKVEAFFREAQKAMRKGKWRVADLQALNQMNRQGMGYALYRLFHLKAQHPLYLRYYPTVYERPSPALAETQQLLDFFDDKMITDEEKVAKLQELKATPVVDDVCKH